MHQHESAVVTQTALALEPPPSHPITPQDAAERSVLTASSTVGGVGRVTITSPLFLLEARSYTTSPVSLARHFGFKVSTEKTSTSCRLHGSCRHM